MNTNDAVAVLREALEVVSRHPMLPSDVIDTCRIALAATDSAATVAKDTAGEPVAYVIYGIDGHGKSVPFDAKLTRHNPEWKTDDDSLGERWSGNEPVYLATPKPEASAATQQAGQALRHEREMAAYTVACKYGHYESEAFKLADEMFACFAAPISEDTGKGKSVSEALGLNIRQCAFCGSAGEHDWAFPHPRTMKPAALVSDACKDCGQVPCKCYNAYGLAPVSDGDAAGVGKCPCAQDWEACIDCDLLKLPAAAIVNGLGRGRRTPYFTADQMRAYGLACRAARTVTGSGGSIANDAGFMRKLGRYWQNSTDESKAELIAYIDARTARNADTSARELTDEQIIECADEYNSGRLNPGGAYIFKRGPLILMVHAILAKSKEQS